MHRYIALGTAVVLAAVGGWLSVTSSAWWLLLAVPAAALAAVGLHDLFQQRHSILRNYPILAHFRYLAEELRPEIQQYFIEQDTEGKPFDRDVRSLVYERAKAVNEEKPFGTELDLQAAGRELLLHTIAPFDDTEVPRVTVGSPDCDQPYEMALLNVSAMSFGSLSSNAILALNEGARRGGFAHDTGEGGISEYHRRPGGDLVWEVGSGYFGCRTEDGHFDAEQFREKARWDQVVATELKLSQGAKPGLGGVLPANKVTEEIAEARGVPQGEKCVSPPSHKVFDTPRGLVEFLAEMRELSGGKPVGFKLCVGYRHEFLAICKAMLDTGITPDFITVDGAEGGTGAAPLEFEDHVGVPLTEGLLTVHNALVATGLRDRIRVAASGKVATGSDIVKRMAIGADYTNSARAMMFAIGCIQAQRCHTNTCPVGVTTQDPKRVRALVPEDKAQRVENFQRETVRSAVRIMASMGVQHPDELTPAHLLQRDEKGHLVTYEEIFDWLEPDELLGGTDRQSWARDWDRADPDSFAPRGAALAG